MIDVLSKVVDFFSTTFFYFCGWIITIYVFTYKEQQNKVYEDNFSKKVNVPIFIIVGLLIYCYIVNTSPSKNYIPQDYQIILGGVFSTLFMYFFAKNLIKMFINIDNKIFVNYHVLQLNKMLLVYKYKKYKSIALNDIYNYSVEKKYEDFYKEQQKYLEKQSDKFIYAVQNLISLLLSNNEKISDQVLGKILDVIMEMHLFFISENELFRKKWLDYITEFLIIDLFNLQKQCRYRHKDVNDKIVSSILTLSVFAYKEDEKTSYFKEMLKKLPSQIKINNEHSYVKEILMSISKGEIHSNINNRYLLFIFYKPPLYTEVDILNIKISITAIYIHNIFYDSDAKNLIRYCLNLINDLFIKKEQVDIKNSVQKSTLTNDKAFKALNSIVSDLEERESLPYFTFLLIRSIEVSHHEAASIIIKFLIKSYPRTNFKKYFDNFEGSVQYPYTVVDILSDTRNKSERYCVERSNLLLCMVEVYYKKNINKDTIVSRLDKYDNKLDYLYLKISRIPYSLVGTDIEIGDLKKEINYKEEQEVKLNKKKKKKKKKVPT